jgi:hypothetical protein
VNWTDREIAAWLDEQLSVERMTQLEAQLRQDESLRSRVANIIRHRDQGGNTVGEIWRRERLSCPTRTELGGYLLRTLPEELLHYIEFHLQTVGCRLCLASLQDLEERSREPSGGIHRRQRFFESSAGLLPHQE